MPTEHDWVSKVPLPVVKTRLARMIHVVCIVLAASTGVVMILWVLSLGPGRDYVNVSHVVGKFPAPGGDSVAAYVYESHTRLTGGSNGSDVRIRSDEHPDDFLVLDYDGPASHLTVKWSDSRALDVLIHGCADVVGIVPEYQGVSVAYTRKASCD